MTTTHTTYSFYCDESGTFRTVDTHIICPLIIKNEILRHDDISQIWKTVYPEGSWQDFHATDMDKIRVHAIFEQLIRDLFDRPEVSAAYIWHQNTRDYQFDFYYALLYRFFLWFFGFILGSEIAHQHNGGRLAVKLNIYLAERGPMNQLSFTKSLQSSFQKMIGDHNRRHALAPDSLSLNTAIYNLPASQSPFIQVSDLLSNMIRASRIGCPFTGSATSFINGLANNQALESELVTDECRTVCGKTRSDRVVTMILKNSERQASPVIRLDESFAQALLESLPNLARESGESLTERISELVDKLMPCDRMEQMVETDHIRLAAETMIKRTRQYVEGSILIQFLLHYIERARATETPVPAWLNRLELQTAVLYLAVNNHQGHFPLTDDCVQQAEKTAEILKQDVACWPIVCDFYNNMAVSLHNIFDFSQATQRLHSLIEHLERELKNPFKGAGITCYEIGALFGSYAQTLAFDAHCTFFRTRDTVSLGRILEEAEYYSELAKAHFTEMADHERQITYQVHFNLQGHILTGEKSYLEAANRLLASDGKTEEAVDLFVKTCPERGMLNPAYRVAAALKAAWLSATPIPQTLEMMDVILKNRDILPQYHPMEQIVAYLAIMADRPDQAKRLRELLGNLKFPPNIVKTIQLILQLQVSYSLKQPITAKQIREIADSLTPDIEPMWRKYGLIDVLQEYTGIPGRWHVGPMEVLPFNYS